MREQTFCMICRKPIEQKATGRWRITCSDRCRQRLYQYNRRERKRWREEALNRDWRVRERVLRSLERQYGPLSARVRFRILHNIPFRQCSECGMPFIERSFKGPAPLTCSKQCASKRKREREIVGAAIERAREAMDARDLGIIERLFERGIKIPVCRHCRMPFVRRGARGRAPTYCSARCRKAAWVASQKVCPVCGKRFDARDGLRRLTRKCCSVQCSKRKAEWDQRDRQGAKICDGYWHYGYGRGAPRTQVALGVMKEEELEIEDFRF